VHNIWILSSIALTLLTTVFLLPRSFCASLPRLFSSLSNSKISFRHYYSLVAFLFGRSSTFVALGIALRVLAPQSTEIKERRVTKSTSHLSIHGWQVLPSSPVASTQYCVCIPPFPKFNPRQRLLSRPQLLAVILKSSAVNIRPF